jgi:hypothetical protein
MRILRLKLENFQGIRSAEYDFGGSSVRFFGDNASGKTTVFNAYTWLLFGKASDGSANFTPKPRQGDGDVHNVDTSVEMAFTHGGKERVIARVFREIWKQKRGNAKKEFSGHETAYFIDGLAVRELDYSKYLFDIAPPERFKILTFPLFFSDELDWSTRREILFSACGNLNDADVIASNPELADFPGLLGSDAAEDFKKKTAAAMKRTNEQLNDLPGRIDEASRAVPETSGIVKEINAELARLGIVKSELETKRSDILNGSTLGASLRKAISEKEAAVSEARVRHLKRNSEMTESVYAQLSDASKRRTSYQSLVNSAKRKVDQAESELEILIARRDRVKANYASVQGELFDENSTVCPTCGREYPQEDARRLREEFNVRKSERLMSILNGGKQVAGKELVAAKEHEIETAKVVLEDTSELLKTTERQIAAINYELSNKTGALQSFEQTAEYSELNGELEKLRAQSIDDAKMKSAAVEGINAEIAVINADIGRQFQLIAEHNAASQQRERIKQLRLREEELGEAYSEQERRLYLCELFIKSKVAMLDERINSKFKTVRFRLFQEQINGGLKECCDALIPTKEGNLVAWNGAANYAAKVNAGLEIITALAEHWGIELPVWFDGRESTNHLLSVPQQLITFSVSLDGELKFEKE